MEYRTEHTLVDSAQARPLQFFLPLDVGEKLDDLYESEMACIV